LGNDFDSCWPAIELALQNENDFYYIEWVADSIQKRKVHAAKQKENISKRWEKQKVVPDDTNVIRNGYNGNNLVIPLENEIESGNSKRKDSLKEKQLDEPFLVPVMVEEFKKSFSKYPIEEHKDFKACFEMAKKIGEEESLTPVQILSEGREYVLKRWREIITFIQKDKWYSTRSLEYLNKDWQQLNLKLNSNGTNRKNYGNSDEAIFDRP
jgi:hypothetical protein